MMDRPGSEPEVVDTQKLLTAIEQLIAQNASLQDELTATRQQLAAAGKMATAARKEIAGLFDQEQRFDRSKDGRFVTETLNFADASLTLIEGIVNGQATPQPAPEANLRAAVAPFAELWAEWEVAQDLDEGHFIDYIERTCDVELLARNWLALVEAAK